MNSQKHEISLSVATNIIGAQKQAIWATVNTCVAFNSALLALLAAAHQFSIINKNLIILVSILGCISAISWSLIINRHFAYYAYFFAWAREYEQSIHDDKNQMIQLGEKFSRGNEITLPVSNALIRMGWSARLFRVEWLVHIIAISFMLLYGGIIFKAI